jgi:TolB-like protein/Flp pilus assembly protein TadD
MFSQSDRLARFLRFAIENAIAGNTDVLKEYVIGTEVYDRRPPYHPSQDSIVRTEARRLRAKLKEYYESEGRDNPVFIYFRPGTYVPLFRRNENAPVSAREEAFPENELLVKGAGVAVAVLPFQDLSHQPLSALCAQGVTEELIHELGRTDGVRLIGRPPMANAADAPYDIPSLSQRFGLSTVVEGTVRLDQGRLRITARVLGPDGFQLSSHRFDTEAEGAALSRVQEQIATAFASRARPQHSLVRKRKASPSPLTMAAYPMVMHAESLLDEGTALDLPAALLKFQEAREVAPTYARTYCGIAQCNLEMALRGTVPGSGLVAVAKEAANRAIELDPEMIEPYSCLGGAQALSWEVEEAERSFLHGERLGMNAPAARRYALYLTALGRFEEAANRFEAVQQVDPFSNRQKVSWAKFLYMTGRFEEASRRLSEPLLYGPLPVEERFLIALMLAHRGDRVRARKLVEEIRAAHGRQPAMIAGIAEILAMIGEQGEAQQLAESLKLLSLDTALSRYRQALLALALGNPDGALTFLRLALEDREPELVWIRVEPRLRSLQGGAAFEEIADSVLPRG